MSAKLLLTVLSCTMLLAFVVNRVSCEDEELFEELSGREQSLSEKIASTAPIAARNSWDSLMNANLNGFYNTLVWKIYSSDLDKLPGFNSTKATAIAIAGHFALILAGRHLIHYQAS